MNQERTQRAFDILAEQFSRYNWQLHDVPGTGGKDSQWHWLGSDEEEIMVCVYRGTYLHEPFHRQDFFYFNYEWKGSFQAVGQTRQNLITVNEGDLIAGQPFTGYALRVKAPEDVEIVGVLVRKDVFFLELLPILSKSSRLLHFFLEPESGRGRRRCPRRRGAHRRPTSGRRSCTSPRCWPKAPSRGCRPRPSRSGTPARPRCRCARPGRGRPWSRSSSRCSADCRQPLRSGSC